MTTPGGLRLHPFRGVRYVPERVGSLAAVTSPPYDVVVRPDGLHHLESADPYNIVRLILPQTAGTGDRHQQAADTLHRWLADGILARDDREALYVYEQSNDEILQRGIIGALELSDRAQHIVLPHEDVMQDVVADRAELMRATEANLEPLLLSYAGDGSAAGATAVIERTVELPPLLATTTEDGFSHRLWAVSDPAELATITDDLEQRQALIADGHHRWATYLRLRAEQSGPSPWDHGLVLLVDTARYPLRVRAIHRLLHQLPPAKALETVSALFRVRAVDGPLPAALDALAEAAGASNAFLLTGDGTYHLLDQPAPDLLARTIRTDLPEAWGNLDAAVLHATLLDHVWQVPDSPEHIAYIHDAQSTVAKAERDGGTAILMHPVSEATVRDLARQGVTMPRKSTSFGPKPATGLVLRNLAD
ncbi:hypothetical protein DSC45_09890 [Streptomyces sp. YIM 130001]|uniref:DUF1015 family protein n=1 Tax=Streptomyces sp. YIM 130001 TaxID=2259644 RepID=UPI000E64C675|nr:DUF1015 domain-containing protein [Streptomyces sp. YIM 130001]RII18922.1 hypothetical protein DSC45_09890 [Streptomyces sp. YIM 130001]